MRLFGHDLGNCRKPSGGIEEVGERLYRTVIDIASGTLTRSETLYYTEPIDMYLQETRF